MCDSQNRRKPGILYVGSVLYNRCKRAKGFVRITVRNARDDEADEDYDR